MGGFRQIIGIDTNPRLPEFDYKIFPTLLTFFSILLFISSFKSKKLGKIVSISLLIFGILMAGWTQFRLYQQGHNLDPQAPLRYVVKPFTPPLIGIIRVHKITIYHLPYIGFFLFGLACFLVSYNSFAKKKWVKDEIP